MQFKNTTKLFYGGFPYKLVLHHQGIDVDNWYSHMRKTLESLRSLPKDSYRVRHMNSMQLFFKARKDLINVLDRDHKFAVEVHEPLNGKHFEHLMKNPNCITRTTLFWNKYRYKITFSNSERFSADWFKGFFSDRDPSRYRYGSSLAKMIRAKGHYEYYWCNPVLYLAEHDDVMLCKLAMNDKILKIETAITFDEFKEDKK
tara:strand:- start:536 stop:1138 length:603 start_codon:yes stop_codon:yes gene_type:complete